MYETREVIDPLQPVYEERLKIEFINGIIQIVGASGRITVPTACDIKTRYYCLPYHDDQPMLRIRYTAPYNDPDTLFNLPILIDWLNN